MPQYHVSALAEADLRDLWAYVDGRDGSGPADELIDRIFDRFSLLAEHPYLGRARPEFDPKLRSHLVPGTPFIIFYFPADYGVQIARLVHGSRRLTDLFQE
jgi:plasmid stabilization system protein ParE